MAHVRVQTHNLHRSELGLPSRADSPLAHKMGGRGAVLEDGLRRRASLSSKTDWCVSPTASCHLSVLESVCSFPAFHSAGCCCDCERLAGTWRPRAAARETLLVPVWWAEPVDDTAGGGPVNEFSHTGTKRRRGAAGLVRRPGVSRPNRSSGHSDMNSVCVCSRDCV